MATPLEKIKQGIEKGDMKQVVAGYNRLTGEKLKAPASATPSSLQGKKKDITLGDVPEAIRLKITQEALEDVAKQAQNLLDVVAGVGRMARQLVHCVSKDPVTSREEEEEEEEDDSPEAVVEVYEPLSEEEVPPTDARGHAPNAPNSLEARASNARAILRGEVPLPDFSHEHTGRPQQEDNPELGVRCRTEAVVKGKFKNEFVDDGTEAKKDKKFDRQVTRGMKPTPRRPPLRILTCTCVKCEKSFRVDEKLAPQTIRTPGGDNEATSFVCQGCVRKGIE